MRTEHVALYTIRLEEMKVFYEFYFGVNANQKYQNPVTGLKTYFMSFDGGIRLELMSHPEYQNRRDALGLAAIMLQFVVPIENKLIR